MRIIIPALILLLSVSTVPAQSLTTPSDDTSEEAPVEYAVELLIFIRDNNPNAENWPADVEPPEPREAIATVTGEKPPEFPPDLRLSDEQQPPQPYGTQQPAIKMGEEALSLEAMAMASGDRPIHALPRDYLKLTAEAESLRRKGLAPVLHTAWRQVVGDRDNKDWLWLETEQLYGLVRISLGRYLHIDSRLLLLGSSSETTPPQAILSSDHRRLRSGELHHLDHPGFGILVQIDRYEAPAGSEPLMLESLDSLNEKPVAGKQQAQ